MVKYVGHALRMRNPYSPTTGSAKFKLSHVILVNPMTELVECYFTHFGGDHKFIIIIMKIMKL